MKSNGKSLKPFLVLSSTQSLSSLGSAMTSFALVIWSYSQSGSALSTALLTICSYAPYVLMSIFAGALSDRWNKKTTMIVCDLFAAMTTLCVMVLLITDRLQLHHLYIINAVNGLMNTLQQPASEVSFSLLTPKEHIQRVGGLTALANALLFPRVMLCGASGVVFAFIVLSSLTGFREGEVPLTFVLVVVLFLGQELLQGILVQDDVANFAHIIGGVIGASTGFGLAGTRVRN
jgi:MFS family permease